MVYYIFVVKTLMYSVVNRLCVSFKFVFLNSSIPASWKTANIMPILKRVLYLALVIGLR